MQDKTNKDTLLFPASNTSSEIINLKRKTVREIVDNVKKYCKNLTIDNIISNIVRLKSGYIEHSFYNKLLLIRYFLILDGEDEFSSLLYEKLILIIESMYFSQSIHKKMLYEIGIHEKDIDKIVKVIGTNYKDIFEMKKLLKQNYYNFYGLNFISQYIINNL